MIKALTIKPLLWACGILVAALAAVVVFHVVSAARAEAAFAKVNADLTIRTGELAAADTKVRELAATSAASHKAVEDLAGKLDTAIKETENLDQLLAAAESGLDRSRRERQDAIELLTAKRENDYATDASCADWGTAPVCGRITGSVQEQWRQAQRRR